MQLAALPANSSPATLLCYASSATKSGKAEKPVKTFRESVASDLSNESGYERKKWNEEKDPKPKEVENYSESEHE